MKVYGDEWGRHFSVATPRSIVVAPKSQPSFAVTRLVSATPPKEISEDIPTEDTFLISVALEPLREGLWEHWSAGKALTVPGIPPFHTSVFDMQASQVVWVKAPFDSIDFNIPRKTIDIYTEDHGLPRVSSIVPKICENDQVIANLTKMILPMLEDSSGQSELFLSHFGLMLCSRLVEGYAANPLTIGVFRGGLAPWQCRRAEELLLNHLSGDLSIDRLAQECGLSSAHFARAFKTTFGVSAHRWVIDRRIDHAKVLLTQSGISLIDVAAYCGFSGQSTFTRAFQQRVGLSPGQWRRQVGPSRVGAPDIEVPAPPSAAEPAG